VTLGVSYEFGKGGPAISVYVGTDVHRERSQVAIVTEDGEVQVNRNVPNGLQPILNLIAGGAISGARPAGSDCVESSHASQRPGAIVLGISIVDADVVGGIGGDVVGGRGGDGGERAQRAVGVAVAIPRIPPQLVQPVASNTGSGTGAARGPRSRPWTRKIETTTPAKAMSAPAKNAA
jgi:hypothetical protein